MTIPASAAPRLSYLSPKAVVLPSPIHSRGLFAAERIGRDEIVAIKGGYVFDRRVLSGITRDLGPAEIQIARDLFIGPRGEAEREGGMIFSNHSCDPNVGVEGQIVFVALRDVSPGEELTHDWATTDDDTYELSCRCGAPGCRRIITGQDWRCPELQARYGGHMAWHLLRRIRESKVEADQ